MFAIVIITVICLVSVALGYLAYYRGFTKSADDYFVAGSSLGYFVLIFSLLASFLSAFAMFGMSSLGYRSGFGSLFVLTVNLVPLGFLWYFILVIHMYQLPMPMYDFLLLQNLERKIFGGLGVGLISHLIMVSKKIVFIGIEPPNKPVMLLVMMCMITIKKVAMIIFIYRTEKKLVVLVDYFLMM